MSSKRLLRCAVSDAANAKVTMEMRLEEDELEWQKTNRCAWSLFVEGTPEAKGGGRSGSQTAGARGRRSCRRV